MKLAVTAAGPDLDAPVDPRFGRAKYFLVVDTDSSEVIVIDNEVNLAATQGAGIQAGKRIVELGVEALLSGHVGPKAYTTLRAGGVEIYSGVAGSVAEAVERFKRGELKPAATSDVAGHWG
jgi:predicted Fe-Mo cluster-binding NifX family protein